MRPALPTFTTLLLAAAMYLASYAVLVDPQKIVEFEWPDQQTQVIRQTVYAPLLRIDPRVHEAIITRDAFLNAVTPGTQMGSASLNVERK
ncbi:MAG: hypothetical protein AB8G99_21350 [Planctomycetaceae bacterium]